MRDILIVEDGQQERERLEKLFGSAGYQVTACCSVAAAEASLTESKYRLAILDIGLGDKSGSLLFDKLKKSDVVSYVIIFTGNPSVHLKQRLMADGAADYIVKASPEAQSEQFLGRVVELLGEPQGIVAHGMPLEEFIGSYIEESSRQLFLDMDDSFPACSACGASDYVVTFSHQPQLPPEITGLVVCAGCGQKMDPEVA